MIVRAARAKLVAKDRNVKLQGMEEKGPVNEILAQGKLIDFGGKSSYPKF